MNIKYKQNIDFNIIVRNGNIFISGNDNIDILKSDSKIKVIDDSYKKLSKKRTLGYNLNIKEGEFMNSVTQNAQVVIRDFLLVSELTKDYAIEFKVIPHN